MGMEKVKIVVAEDFFPFRSLIVATLAKNSSLQVICEVADGQEAVWKAQELQPDLILLDIGLPSLNGIAAARQIRKVSPDSKIIFVTQESSPEVVQEALAIGAQGYLVKSSVNGSLLAAVEAVVAGKQYLSDGLKPPDSV